MDSKKRFSNRVENYVNYRPRYPDELLEFLRDELGLRPTHVVADIGSGTGILSELFLRNGNRVYGVEPNLEMREASIRLLTAYENFISIDGSAEETGLPDGAVDYITAGQAFHWFDPDKARTEFKRIIKPDGYVALIWNTRTSNDSTLAAEYEALLNEHAIEYREVGHKKGGDERIENFFGQNNFGVATFDNYQLFDFEGLKGRLLSSSYAPLAGHPNHAPMVAGLEKLFEKYVVNGRVKMEYETRLYYGRVKQSSYQ